ncbi:50S ribosomal protein L6 [Arenicellales bacterium IMCC55707]|jgi:large subunit ribosomal protein L6
MSRVAKNPISLPTGVEAKIAPTAVSVKGPKGELSLDLHPEVTVEQLDGVLKVAPHSNDSWAMAGTFRALISNMVSGVTNGFERKLEIVGVGYRAQAQGQKLNLSLGFSHPVVYQMPDGVTVETPTQTEIVLKGADKQRVGQAAAEIRAFRPPEPYKGKGIRYAGEYVVRKQAKKK